MVRVLILAALICVCGILSSSMAEARTIDSDASTTNTPEPTTLKDKVSTIEEDEERYHPVEVQKPRVLEERNKRYSDGNYEYRYALSNGVTRYEKSYWTSAGDGKKVLAHKGFFSHPLPNNKYITVFYTADETGYHQDSSTFTQNAPLLPKHLEVPEMDVPIEITTPTITTRKTTTTTTTTTTTPKPTTTSTTTTTPKPTTTTTTRKPRRTTTTRKPRKTTTRRPRPTTTKKSLKKPSNFNWIY